MKENIFNQAIERLYRAPLDEDAWQLFFDTLTRLFPCLGWQYLAIDHSGVILFSICSASLQGSDYQPIRHWLSHDLPGILLSGKYDAGNADILRFELPRGSDLTGRHASVSVLPEEQDSLSILALVWARNASPMETQNDALYWLLRLHPHLKQAVRISMEIHHLRNEIAIHEKTLDRFGYPLFLIDESGGIEFFNRAADQWQSENDAFCFRLGYFIGRNKENQTVLDNLLHYSIMRGRYSLRGFLCSNSQRPYQMIVLPLSDPPDDAGSNDHRALFLIIIGDLKSGANLTVDNLQALFGFTGAEARVTLGLAEGKTLEEIAQAGEVSINTVRSQLRQALEKTGTCRQTELVRLITALPRLNLENDINV